MNSTTPNNLNLLNSLSSNFRICACTQQSHHSCIVINKTCDVDFPVIVLVIR